jgi:hypothetical protein
VKKLRETLSKWEKKDPVTFAIALVGGCELVLCLMIYAVMGA